jgi:rubrerythrin
MTLEAEVCEMNVDDRPIGLSVWEQELYERLVQHIASESEVLARYEGLAEESSGHVRFLLDLIAEDEARHHRLYDEWARTVREMVLVTEPGDAVPDLTREPDPDRLVAAVDDLLAVEKDDAQQLKVLEKSLKDVRHTTVWPLLVELMEMDTRKHIKILEFLREHAQHTARGR